MSRILIRTGIVIVLLAAGVFLTIRHLVPQTNYLSGRLISFADQLQESNVKASPLSSTFRKIDRELLDGEWRCVNILNSGVMLWKTHSRLPIDSSRGIPELFQGSERVQMQRNLFLEGTPPGRWDWLGNQVLITSRSNVSSSKFYLSYHVIPGIEHSMNVKLNASPFVELESNPKLTLFPLAPGVGSTIRDVVLYRNGVPLPVQSKLRKNMDRLMRAQRQAREGPPKSTAVPRGWLYLDRAEFSLFAAKEGREYPLLRAGQKLQQRRFFSAGIANIIITARADLVGHDFPQLGIYFGQKQIGTISLSDKGYRSYSVVAAIPPGWHQFRISFENDDLDHQKNLDRNVFLREVRIQYPHSLAIADSESNSSYTVKYKQLASPQLQWTGFLRTQATFAGETRKAIYCPPPTVVTFPVKVPENASLLFGYGLFSTARAPMELKITAKNRLGSPRTLFHKRVTRGKDWQDQQIDLSSFARKKIELSFETIFPEKSVADTPLLVLSNPVLISRNSSGEKHPSVFIIVGDALRADHLNCYGYRKNTSPHINQLAKDGVLFESAVSQSSWTLASIASMFTSLYPSFHRTEFRESKLSDLLPTAAEMAAKNGYLTTGFVQNGFLASERGFDRGFHWYRVDLIEENTESRLVNVFRRLDEIQKHKMFFFLHILEPHSPYTPPQRIAAEMGIVPDRNLDSSTERLHRLNITRQLLSSRERDHLIDHYDGEVRYFDETVGRFVNQLKQKGLYDDSLIIVTSDHGEEFQEHGHVMHTQTLYQEVVHVPLIIKFPRRYSFSNRRVAQNVQSIDLLPTILNVSGIAVPSFLQGKSLVPLASGKDRSFFDARPVYAELNIARQLGILQGSIKYIYKHHTRSEELYDLRTDPQEKRNLATQKPELLQTFRKLRDDFRTKAADHRAGKQDPGKVALDEQQDEQLRALGYIQ